MRIDPSLGHAVPNLIFTGNDPPVGQRHIHENNLYEVIFTKILLLSVFMNELYQLTLCGGACD